MGQQPAPLTASRAPGRRAARQRVRRGRVPHPPVPGLADFAVVQSYLSTAAKWGISRPGALRQLLTTGPWLPPAVTPP